MAGGQVLGKGHFTVVEHSIILVPTVLNGMTH